MKITEPISRMIEYGTKTEPVSQSCLSITDDILVAVDKEACMLTTASGQVLPYAQVLTCTATAYTTERQSWKLTATGTTARVGAIAVDPKVIPYGTTLYIVSADGSITYGIATAEDCGCYQGNKIDLFFDTMTKHHFGAGRVRFTSSNKRIHKMEKSKDIHRTSPFLYLFCRLLYIPDAHMDIKIIHNSQLCTS